MRHSRRTEAILFEQIKQLSDNIPRLQHDVHSELQPSVQSDISTAAVFPKQETGQLPPLSALQPPHGVAEHQAELPPPSQPLHAQPQMHVVQPAPVQRGLYKRWMHPDSRSKEEIGETIILEQFLRVLQPDVRTWVKEHNPKTGGEAGDLAERYLAAHREPSKSKMTVGRPRFGEVKPPGVASVESLDTRGGKKPIHCSQRYNLICYYCQQPGHKASLCPLRKPKSVELCVVPSTGLEGELTGDGLVPHKHVVDVSTRWPPQR
uniref:SCAN box domain-containing protein n=1 Tax=Oreochromis niloticus TaxID=8128 RepID=A0A669BUY9_ORENI